MQTLHLQKTNIQPCRSSIFFVLLSSWLLCAVILLKFSLTRTSHNQVVVSMETARFSQTKRGSVTYERSQERVRDEAE
jgi:hypothetical protein